MDARGRTTRLRNPQFASFMERSSGLSERNSDRYDARLRRRKFGRALLAAFFGSGAIWVAIESAHALTLF